MKNRKMELLCTLVFSFLFFSSTFSQYNNLGFKHLTTRDGLSQNLIGTIVQDKEGFMWFSTKDGLNRYDGYEFKVYRYEPFDSNSISGTMVTASYVDSRGRLWIGTNSLNLFQPEKNGFKRIDLSPGPGSRGKLRPFSNINAITEDKNEILWVGTDNGLFYYNPVNGAYKFFYQNSDTGKGSKDDFICSLIYKGSRLFIGTRNGLKLINPDTLITSDGNITGIMHFSPGQILAGKSYIICQFLTPKDILYCGTLEGLIKIDVSKKTSQFIPYLGYKFHPDWLGKIVSMCGDNQGNLWLACPGGLVIYDIVKSKFKYYFHNPLNNKSLSLSNISYVYADRQGKIWIGTAGKGINVYNQNRKAFSLYNGLPEQEPFMSTFSIYSILADSKNILWVSTRQQVYRLDRVTGKYSPVTFPSRTATDVNSILEDKKKNIWISSDQGIYKMSESGQITGHYIHDPSDSSSLKDNLVKLLYIDTNGDLYAVNADYLSKMDEKSGSFTHYKLNFTKAPDFIPVIKSIHDNGDGWFWFGWNKGFVKYNPKTEVTTIFKHKPEDKKSISSNEVLSICSDPAQPNKYLWLGTDGGGLNRFNTEDETFDRYTVKDGLPNNVIYGILTSGRDELWLSTNNGLCKVMIDGKGITGIKNFDESDGLQGNEFNTGAYSKSPNGELLFGGLYGINAFFPSEIKENSYVPPVVFTKLKLLTDVQPDNNSTKAIIDYFPDNSVITIPFSENSFSVWFASLDYSNPNKNNYMYMLKPINKNWINIGTQRNVTFTNLAQGDYEFLIKGSNNDGIWNEKGAVLKIIIPPPFWLTWWAYFLYILIIFAVLYLIRRYELKRHEWKHNLELETVEAFKYKELNRVKSLFFANISHEFRTPLTLILGPAERIDCKSSDEEVKKHVNSIKKNANRLMDLINQLLELSKIEAGKLELEASKSNIVSFIKGITMSFESAAEEKDITLTVESDTDEIELYFDREKMVKIMTNLISNAVKFTHAGGSITVSVSNKYENRTDISVRDTGIGIPSEELPRLFDRFYQVDSSQTREYGGTGIGLALIKELVDLHQGRITVKSEPEKQGMPGTGWTEFTISYPMGRDQLRDYEIVKPEVPPESIPFTGSKDSASEQFEALREHEAGYENKNIILVVEDNSDVREFISDILSEDFRIEEAINGEQGFRKAEQLIPDLVLCDLMMPKMDGRELTRRLKNDEKTSHIPVILLTAKSDQASRLEGLETGADDYIVKPFDTEELQIRIKNLIRNRQKLQEKYRKNDYLTMRKETDSKKLNDREEQFLSKVMAVIEKHIPEEAFSIEQFGEEVGMSRVQLHRKLKALTGKSASNYLKYVRLSRARKLIEEDKGNISEIAYSVGFSSPAYFTRCFKEEYGFPPSDLLGH